MRPLINECQHFYHLGVMEIQPLAARQGEKLAMCFESYKEAKRRCETSQKAENEKRSPIGNFENMQWDKQALLDEVNSYADGTLINWSVSRICK